MVEHAATRNPDRCPTRPGELLREAAIPATGRTETEIADLLGMSRHHQHDLPEERKPVSAPWRPGLASFSGMAPGPGGGLIRDTWRAERTLEDEIRKIPTSRPVSV